MTDSVAAAAAEETMELAAMEEAMGETSLVLIWSIASKTADSVAATAAEVAVTAASVLQHSPEGQIHYSPVRLMLDGSVLEPKDATTGSEAMAPVVSEVSLRFRGAARAREAPRARVVMVRQRIRPATIPRY